jgi:hypothetical protein
VPGLPTARYRGPMLTLTSVPKFSGATRFRSRVRCSIRLRVSIVDRYRVGNRDDAPVEEEPVRAAPALLEHARRLHEASPDAPLPRDGYPFPDESKHRRRRSPRPSSWRAQGIAAADIITDYLATPHDDLIRVEAAFHEVDVPIHRNEHIVAAALRADQDTVHDVGRWLVEQARDRCAALVGLALIAAKPNVDDVEVIRTVGLLSDKFAPLAAEALRRVQDGDEALLWLAQRSSGWGRVYYVEALCAYAHRHRDWLLRSACDGEFLNGYFAGKVAIEASLHEAIARPVVDDAVVDHTGVPPSRPGRLGLRSVRQRPGRGRDRVHQSTRRPAEVRARHLRDSRSPTWTPCAHGLRKDTCVGATRASESRRLPRP